MIDLDNLMKKADTNNYYCRQLTRKLQFSLSLKNYQEVSLVFGKIHELELTPNKINTSNNALAVDLSLLYKDFDKVREFAKFVIERNINIRAEML